MKRFILLVSVYLVFVCKSYSHYSGHEACLPDSISYPWSSISLTGELMKPGYPFAVAGSNAFPWIPVIAGVAAGGTAIYFLTKDDTETPEDCSFTASAQPAGSTCGLSNGAIVTTIAPQDEYSYVWSNGAVLSALSQVPAGNYSVTITRTGTSCTQILTTTVTNSNPPITASITPHDSDCDQQNGSATVNPSPPGSYTYAWSNGSTQQNQSGLAPGSYTVTISAGGECEQSFSTQIGTTPFDPSVTFTTTPSTCGGSDGTAMVMVDPAGLYTFTWSDGQSGSQATGLSSGSYSVTISKSGTSCTTDAEIIVEELPASFTVAVTSTPAGCGLSDGTATVTVDPPGTYDISWSNGQMGNQLSGVAAGEYTVTVSLSGFDCSQEAGVTIESDPFPYNVSLSATPAHCGMADGSASVSVTPQGEFGYQWSNGGNGAQLTGLNAGSYTVTITDIVTSCAKEFTVTVEELPPSFAISFTTTPAGCGMANGAANVTVDPPAAYEFIWSNGSIGPQLSGVPSGQYIVTVTLSGSSCSNSASITVDQAGGGFTATFATENADCGLANGSTSIAIDPAGEYTYQWSNQQSGPHLQQISGGTYTVIVTDMNSCTEEFSVTVPEDPAEYISITTTSPGNCAGGGEIVYTLATPGSGPLNVQVEGPQGTMPLSLPPGSYMLSSFIPVLPGTYTFTVYDEQTGNSCYEIVNATVSDNTPSLLATDDFYITPGGQPVTQNVLDNDSGLSISVISISNPFGGTVSFSSSGTFTFIPNAGFSGDASFTYTVTDACGLTSTAVVTISVEVIICDFNVEFETTPASCGLEDGMISADVIEPGTYTFLWSNGDSGPIINSIYAGTYTVTVTDVNLGCNLTFSVVLSENPADYISDIIITQPSCGSPGEIQFTAFTNSQNQLIMMVTGPNGTSSFFIEPGIIRLSDYISITPGDYIIELSDAGAGPDCFESTEATIVAAGTPEIITEAVFPPSEPTAMDGAIVVVVTTPGIIPYTVLLNGVPVMTTPNNNFIISGLGVGTYNVQIIDASGCASNVLVVFVPLPDIILSLGTGLFQVPSEISGESPAQPLSSPQWRSGMIVSVRYHLGTVGQELRMVYTLPGTAHYGHRDQNSYVQAEYLSTIKNIKWKKMHAIAQIGIGGQYIHQGNYTIENSPPPCYWSLRLSTGYAIKNLLHLRGAIALRGWDKIGKPMLEFSASVPVSIRRFSIH